MIDFGIVRPGTTLYIPFATYDSNDPTASVTMTGFAVTDIEIYKDGGTTQRASDNGYTLLDTDGIDFDGVTGIHGFSVNLADNSTAGFYSSGSQYWIVVSSITVDSGTVNFIAGTFGIGYEDALLNTTIATLSSQTSFTLTAGPPDNDALVGCIAVIHDVASATQIKFGVVSAYAWTTRTVTLGSDSGIFIAAATDNISFYPPVNTRWLSGAAQTARDIGASVLLSSGTGAGQVSLSSGAVTTGTVNDKTGYSLTANTGLGNQTANITGNLSGSVGSVTSSVTVGTNSDKTGYTLSSPGVQAVWDALTSALTTIGSIGKLLADNVNTSISSRSNHNAADVWAVAARVLTANTNLNDPSAAAIADAVWDEVLSGHLAGGSTGAALNAAGSAGDPWTTTLPGTYTGTQAGKVLSDILIDTAEIGVAGAGLTNINLPDQTMNIVGNITGNLSGSVGSVTGNTAQTGDAYAYLTSNLGVAGAAATEAGGTGDHLTAMPWNAAWDAEVQSECADALAAYDSPTNAEMEARTLVSANYATPTNITAGTITTVTNLTNAPISGDFTTTMKASINAEVVDVLRTDTIPDSYPAHEAQPTLAQAVLAIHQFLMEREVSGTTVTVQKPDGTTTAMTMTVNSATDPTTIHRSA